MLKINKNKIEYQGGLVTPKHREGGQAMLVSVIFFLFISFATSIGLVGSSVREYKIVNDELIDSKRSFYLSETGAEDIFQRLGLTYTYTTDGDGTPDWDSESGPDEYIMVASNWVDTDVDVGNPDPADTAFYTNYEWVVRGLGTAFYRSRRTEAIINRGAGARFHYGVQTGTGGLAISNSSIVSGSVYANGPISGSGNTITGDATSSGATGSITSIRTNDDMYAHTITNSTVDSDAYYTSISGSSVGGTSYSGFADQATIPMPISDAIITSIKSTATAGGDVTCTAGSYTISATVSIGPKRVPCNLIINGGTVTLTGHLLVTGNVTISGSANLVAGATDGLNSSVAIVADGASSTITVTNTGTYTGGGTNAYVFLISQNTNPAVNGVDIGGSASGALVSQATTGKVLLKSTANLAAVAAHTVAMQDSAQIAYDTDLKSVVFSYGASGTWNITNWREY